MLTIDQALSEKWYYTVELAPGRMTPGFSFKNISVARRALESIDVKGASVLDVSTMEGMFSVLLARRGARVTATDGINLTTRIKLLQDVYGVDFNYYGHAPVKNFADFLFEMQSSAAQNATRPLRVATETGFGYDVVLASGLIYHVINPIEHLLNYRKLTKRGGLLVLETATLLSDEIEMIHDWQGESAQAFGGRATWFVSTRALDVWLRACFFEPLGFAYVRSKGSTARDLARIAIVARAVDTRAFSEAQTRFLSKSEVFNNYDFKPLFPAAQLTGDSARPPRFDESVLHPATDLRGSVVTGLPELKFDDDYLTLRLNDA